MSEFKDKIDPLKNILEIKCDYYLKILVGHIIRYFKQKTNTDERIFVFRDLIMSIAHTEWKKDEDICPLMQILQEVHIITSTENPFFR